MRSLHLSCAACVALYVDVCIQMCIHTYTNVYTYIYKCVHIHIQMCTSDAKRSVGALRRVGYSIQEVGYSILEYMCVCVYSLYVCVRIFSILEYCTPLVAMRLVLRLVGYSIQE